MFNKPLQQKYGLQRKLSYWYTSMPSVCSLAKKLNLLLNTGTVVMSQVGHVLSIQLGAITWCSQRPTTTILDI